MNIVVARIGKPHGIRGEVTVQVLTDAPEDRLSVGSTLEVEGKPGLGELTIRSARWNKTILILGFESVNDRNGAEEIRGARLSIDPREEGEAAEEDEYYEHELVGLSILDAQENRAPLGVVRGLRTGAAQDLIVAEIDSQEVLIPFVEQIVLEVDTHAGYLLVDLPLGLIDLAKGL